MIYSKRAFQTQFKRWDFPSKQNPAHRNGPLVARVKELWERNTSQKEMLRILQEDGFDIKERELMRVRAKNRWLLRVPNGMKPTGKQSTFKTEDAAMAQLEQEFLDQQNNEMQAENAAMEPSIQRPPSPEVTPEIINKRQQRMAQLQQESEQRWSTRKRRRRTRGWAGLPADPPGPPRFPSETTIDESKAYLNLTNDLYKDVRDRFQRICEEGGFLKKTIAGPERWQAAKDRLVQESPHLQSMFWGSNAQLESKALALDVVCSDVTKRMRTLETRMTIADAKNALGINPEESRDIRNGFYQTLKEDHFTSKIEAGEEHWKELKNQWIQGSDLLKQILSPGPTDPTHALKLKAIEVLCRDVMKRLRDDQTKRDPTRKKPRVYGPGPGPAAPTPARESSRSVMRTQMQNQTSNQAPEHTHPHGHSRGPAEVHLAEQAQVDHGDLQIDPSLLLAANDPSLVMDQQQHQFVQAFPPPPSYPHRISPSLPVYFRLGPMSQIQHNAKLWLATLGSISVNELRQLATSKHPNTISVRIDGIVRDENNNEVSFAIDEDEELGAYLAHVNGGKATFSVQLMPAYQ